MEGEKYRRGELPDIVYLIVETQVDGFFDEIEKLGKDNYKPSPIDTGPISKYFFNLLHEGFRKLGQKEGKVNGT